MDLQSYLDGIAILLIVLSQCSSLWPSRSAIRWLTGVSTTNCSDAHASAEVPSGLLFDGRSRAAIAVRQRSWSPQRGLDVEPVLEIGCQRLRPHALPPVRKDCSDSAQTNTSGVKLHVGTSALVKPVVAESDSTTLCDCLGSRCSQLVRLRQACAETSP
jgi:hypothetical protein